MTIKTTQPRPRWVELDEEEDNNYLEYSFNDEGHKVKKTTTTTRDVRKLANERRGWSKFGGAVHQDVDARLTMVSTEEIVFERPMAPGTKAEDSSSSDPLAAKSGAVLMVCRTCGKKGDHWTSRCPYKDLAQPSETFVDNKGAYVPPITRCDGGVRSADGADLRHRNDENSVRVNNLSEDTREPDLMELFHPFGSVSRVYVAMDQKTGMSRGFGFVNFVRREEGERAIAKLNGYGYDNLILRVEWAAPRAN